MSLPSPAQTKTTPRIRKQVGNGGGVVASAAAPLSLPGHASQAILNLSSPTSLPRIKVGGQGGKKPKMKQEQDGGIVSGSVMTKLEKIAQGRSMWIHEEENDDDKLRLFFLLVCFCFSDDSRLSQLDSQHATITKGSSHIIHSNS